MSKLELKNPIENNCFHLFFRFYGSNIIYVGYLVINFQNLIQKENVLCTVKKVFNFV